MLWGCCFWALPGFVVLSERSLSSCRTPSVVPVPPLGDWLGAVRPRPPTLDTGSGRGPRGGAWVWARGDFRGSVGVIGGSGGYWGVWGSSGAPGNYRDYFGGHWGLSGDFGCPGAPFGGFMG